MTHLSKEEKKIWKESRNGDESFIAQLYGIEIT
jgi:hypothetical protein